MNFFTLFKETCQRIIYCNELFAQEQQVSKKSFFEGKHQWDVSLKRLIFFLWKTFSKSAACSFNIVLTVS